MPRPTITYHRRGMVERRIGTGKSRQIVWRKAYSGTGVHGGILYPWMTMRECRIDAWSRRLRAEFVD